MLKSCIITAKIKQVKVGLVGWCIYFGTTGRKFSSNCENVLNVAAKLRHKSAPVNIRESGFQVFWVFSEDAKQKLQNLALVYVNLLICIVNVCDDDDDDDDDDDVVRGLLTRMSSCVNHDILASQSHSRR